MIIIGTHCCIFITETSLNFKTAKRPLERLDQTSRDVVFVSVSASWVSFTTLALAKWMNDPDKVPQDKVPHVPSL